MKNLNLETIQQEITFGIEIECYVRDETKDFEISGYNYDNGIQVPSMPEGWVATYDNSLGSLPDYTAVEFVSPILKGKRGLEEAMLVADILKNKYKAKITQKTGFHVHVGVPTVLETENEIKKWAINLISYVGHFEIALYAMTGTPYRVNNTYCQSVIDQYNLTDCINESYLELAEKYNNSRQRYVTLNILPLVQNKKNVEFRVFQGTVEKDKIAGYIQICLGLACKALNKGFKQFSKKINRGRKTGIGRTQLDILLENLAWTNRNGKVKIGWILSDEQIKLTIKELRRLANKFDTRIKNQDGFTNDSTFDTYRLLQRLGYFE